MSNRAQLYQYKGNVCSCCGLSVKEMVERHGTFNRMFQLHHVIPDTKHAEYKKLIQRSISSEQIDEVDKCVLLCTQCHATIHAQEITGKLKLSVEIEGRKVFQEFEGWVKADLLDKTYTFVTNQRYLLQPCEVRIGLNQPVVMCAIEIERDENLISWFRNISTHKLVEILSIPDAKVLMRIEHTEENSVKVSQVIGFPVTRIDFATAGSLKDNLWFRNGFVLNKNGEIFTTGVVSYVCNLLPPADA